MAATGSFETMAAFLNGQQDKLVELLRDERDEAWEAYSLPPARIEMLETLFAALVTGSDVGRLFSEL